MDDVFGGNFKCHRSLSVVFKLMDVCLWNGVVEGSWLWFILCGVEIQNGLWFMVWCVAGCWMGW